MVLTRIVPSQPAMILEGQKRHLIATDLHIGFESGMASNQIFVGKNTSINESIEQITSMIYSESPDDLILLGDVKSSIKTISRSEWDEVPMFLKKLQEKTDIILIPGNHDSNIQKLVPDGITMIGSIGLVIENTLLTHGHTMPTENFSHVDKIIMGHVHPVFFEEDSVLNGQRVWVSLKARKEKLFPSTSGEIEITIVPSFNRYFYATRKKTYKKSISPILERVKNFSSAKIATLDGTIIGDESLLSQVI